MKFYKPFFSIITILIQLMLSLKHHYEHIKWTEEMKKTDPELFGLICYNTTYTSLFIFVCIIGFYEMLTKPSWFKTIIRIFLVCIILGTTFSDFIPIDQFYYGVYNTAWFSAVVTIVLILVRIGKYSFGKINDRKLNKASR
ncbi:hypothetical protein [Cochleicola gelatinilyticus]|uniref:Uncharacterized protein n=1 Tax=Cochleicola gelatinilyticus TaxID=1763537 RepID=A0A167HWI5_9FLAO|nr:hypothetical protein [Cochleicola gelatinilyticus]OAB79045.1 hypothetical protein ULVI_07680 [Cochleicola gelatinilyticus]